MQLRQSEPLGIFDKHDRGIRNVDAHLDHGRANQCFRFSGAEPLHDRLLVGWSDSSMQQFAAKRSQPFLPDLELFRGGLGLELFALIDQRINDVGLASSRQSSKFRGRRKWSWLTSVEWELPS